MPLKTIFTEAICLDLSHNRLKSDISIADLQPSLPKSPSSQGHRLHRESDLRSMQD